MTLSRFKFCGEPLSKVDISVIREVIDSCGLNRTELALTICEIMEWTRPNGQAKRVECLKFLDMLEERGLVQMPEADSRSLNRKGKSPSPQKPIELPDLHGTLSQFGPVWLEVVTPGEASRQWKQLIENHHYLGFKTAYGANIRYFIKVTKPRPAIVGCLQFSSPAFRVEVRDQFLAWNVPQRKAHLQKIIQNSRFLILPTVSIKGLASHTLSLIKKCLPSDWEERYAIRPWWCETFVDTSRFKGTCYQAANWHYLGETKGTGRTTTKGETCLKSVWLLPIAGKNTRQKWNRLICKS